MKKILSLLFVVIIVSICGCGKKSKPEDLSILTSAMQSVEMILQTEVSRLHNIAQLSETQAGDWDFIKSELIKNNLERTKSLYWYSLPDGSYYTSDKDKVEANLSSREYFPALLKGKDVVGYPVLGKTSGKKSIVIAVPITVNAEVVGILGTSVFLDEFWDLLKAKIQIPKKYDFYAVNSEGITIFDLETKDHLLDKVLEQPAPTLVEAIKVIILTDEGELNYKWNGKNKISVYLKSPISDWRYVLSFY
jgi:methyl-accepting chemotaxis protein